MPVLVVSIYLSALSNLLISHGQASQRLRIAFARFVEWMANNFPSWAAYRALMSCRKLVLGKDLIGICPIRNGNIFWQATAKYVLVVAGPLATTECGSDQLCAGLNAGVDSVVHVALVVWIEMDQDEFNVQWLSSHRCWNFFQFLFKGEYAMECLSSLASRGAFAFNCYSFATLLICCNHAGEAMWMFAREGSIQREIPCLCFNMALGYFPSFAN